MNKIIFSGLLLLASTGRLYAADGTPNTPAAAPKPGAGSAAAADSPQPAKNA